VEIKAFNGQILGRVTPEDLAATYALPDERVDDPVIDGDLRDLRERARRFRANGDHIAAGDIERDIAVVLRMEHERRAKAHAAARCRLVPDPVWGPMFYIRSAAR